MRAGVKCGANVFCWKLAYFHSLLYKTSHWQQPQRKLRWVEHTVKDGISDAQAVMHKNTLWYKRQQNRGSRYYRSGTPVNVGVWYWQNLMIMKPGWDGKYGRLSNATLLNVMNGGGTDGVSVLLRDTGLGLVAAGCSPPPSAPAPSILDIRSHNTQSAVSTFSQLHHSKTYLASVLRSS